MIVKISNSIITNKRNQIVYKCKQMFGGYGFMEEYPIGRIYRDVRVAPIYGGTSEIMKEVIAKMVIDQVAYKPVYKKLVLRYLEN